MANAVYSEAILRNPLGRRRGKGSQAVTGLIDKRSAAGHASFARRIAPWCAPSRGYQQRRHGGLKNAANCPGREYRDCQAMMPWSRLLSTVHWVAQTRSRHGCRWGRREGLRLERPEADVPGAAHSRCLAGAGGRRIGTARVRVFRGVESLDADRNQTLDVTLD